MNPNLESRWWLPVAATAEVPDRQPVAARHFDAPLVVWRAGDRLAALDDRCPHRGAQLSLGRVCDDAIECPYHGWRFAVDGRCTSVPSTPGFVAPASHAARSWQVREAHGLVWVAGPGAPPQEPFGPPALDTLPARRVLCGPFDVATSAPRVVENFLDTAHFGFVHEGWLGAREHLEVPDHEVRHDACGRPGVPHYRAWQPQASSAAVGGAWVDYRYQLLSPLSALLHKQSARADTDEAYVLWTCPNGREGCRAWFTICTTDPLAHDDALRAFQERIFDQDRPIVESQRPRELPLAGGEVHCAADRLSAAYRRWLRDLGYAYGCC